MANQTKWPARLTKDWSPDSQSEARREVAEDCGAATNPTKLGWRPVMFQISADLTITPPAHRS